MLITLIYSYDKNGGSRRRRGCRKSIFFCTFLTKSKQVKKMQHQRSVVDDVGCITQCECGLTHRLVTLADLTKTADTVTRWPYNRVTRRPGDPMSDRVTPPPDNHCLFRLEKFKLFSIFLDLYRWQLQLRRHKCYTNSMLNTCWRLTVVVRNIKHFTIYFFILRATTARAAVPAGENADALRYTMPWESFKNAP